METKSTNYRKEHLKLRNAMTRDEVSEKSVRLVHFLLQSEWYKQTKELFVYSPIGTEADCKEVIEQAWRDGKRVAFPRVESETEMNFYYADSYEELAEGSFHVAEPKKTCRLAIPEDQPVLVPGSVFDRNGNRYGYGKGFYDRFFCRYPKLGRIGLCFENQLEEEIPVGEYDVQMHVVYTEHGCYGAGPVEKKKDF